MDRLDNVHFYLEEIQSKENGGTYQVTLKIPSDVGRLSFCEMYLEEVLVLRKKDNKTLGPYGGLAIRKGE